MTTENQPLPVLGQEVTTVVDSETINEYFLPAGSVGEIIDVDGDWVKVSVFVTTGRKGTIYEQEHEDFLYLTIHSLPKVFKEFAVTNNQ